MNADTIRYFNRAEKLQEQLREFNFHHFEYFWYNDGTYSGCWKDMSVSMDAPDRDGHCYWQFGFRSKLSSNSRLNLEGIVPVGDDYFVFNMRYVQEVKLHDRDGYWGPVAVSSIEDILEEDLANVQKFIEYLVK